MNNKERFFLLSMTMLLFFVGGKSQGQNCIDFSNFRSPGCTRTIGTFSNPYATIVSSSYIGILILCVALLIASSSFSQEVFVDNGMYYKVTSAQTCKLIVNPSGGYGCNSENQIVVPSSVVYQSNVYTVSEIGDSAFMSCECEEIVLPETITTLGKSVFADPTGVNKVFLQSSEPPQVDNYTFLGSNSRRISYYIHCDKYRTYQAQ